VTIALVLESDLMTLKISVGCAGSKNIDDDIGFLIYFKKLLGLVCGTLSVNYLSILQIY